MYLVKIIQILFPFFLFFSSMAFGFSLARSYSSTIPSLHKKSPAPTSTSIPRIPLKIKASIPYWDQKRALESVKSNPQVFDQVSMFWYYLSADGRKVVTYGSAREDPKIISYLKAQDIAVTAVITNLPDSESAGWDSKRVERALSDESLRRALIEEINGLLKAKSFMGVIIDFEEVNAVVRDQFSTFIKELVVTLQKDGKTVGVSIHPKTGESTDERYAFQDWKRLSQTADALYIMAYGEHWDEGEPGSIASLGWIREIISYAKSQSISFNKLHLGIPLYGYDWNLDIQEEATGLTYRDVERLVDVYKPNVLRDESSQIPYFYYQSRGDQHEVWFEDAGSAIAKMKLASEAGFAGVSFWRLGGEDDSVWKQIIVFNNP